MKLLVPVPDIWGVNMSKKKKTGVNIGEEGN